MAVWIVCWLVGCRKPKKIDEWMESSKAKNMGDEGEKEAWIDSV